MGEREVIRVDEDEFDRDMSAWFMRASEATVVHVVNKKGDVRMAIGGSFKTPEWELDEAVEEWQALPEAARQAALMDFEATPTRSGVHEAGRAKAVAVLLAASKVR